MNVGKDELKRNTLYNSIGTIVYFFFQWLTTIIVVKIAGFENGGIFSLAISFSNIFYFISLFGVRNLQLSDINNKHNNSDYITTRLVMMVISCLAFVAVIVFLDFPLYTVVCCYIYMIFKLCESFNDVFMGIYQKKNLYKHIAVSQILKGILPVAAFTAFLFLTTNMMIAILSMALVYIAIVFIYDFRKLVNSEKFKLKFSCIKDILKLSYPIMLMSLTMPYINFITRFAVEKLYSSEILGYYSSISMIISVIVTLAGSIWVVLIPRISSMYHDNKFAEIRRWIIKILLFILILAVIAVIISNLLGEWAITLVFGKGLSEYSGLIVPVVIVSFLLIVVNLLNTVLIAVNKRNIMLNCNIVGAIICSITVYSLTKKHSIFGANFSMAIGIATQLIIMLVFFVFILKKKNVKEE